jgi:REP element-mobilizing transposase RayT
MGRSAEENSIVVPVFCFMPDHIHLVARGQSAEADLWKFMFAFKQYSGWWLRCHEKGYHWHKDFFDHLVRGKRDLRNQVRYVVQNPVKGGLVADWREYPYTGAIGVSLKETLEEVGLWDEMTLQAIGGCDG